MYDAYGLYTHSYNLNIIQMCIHQYIPNLRRNAIIQPILPYKSENLILIYVFIKYELNNRFAYFQWSTYNKFDIDVLCSTRNDVYAQNIEKMKNYGLKSARLY